MIPDWRYITFMGMLAAAAGASYMTERRPNDHLEASLDTLPLQIAGWNYQSDSPLDARALERMRAGSHLSRVYTKGGRRLGLLIAFYPKQRAGESMHSPKQCLPGAGWEIWRFQKLPVTTAERENSVNLVSIQNSGERAVVLYWYQSRRNLIASEYVAKATLFKDALLDGRTGGSLVRIVVQDDPGAVAQAQEFASELIPLLQRCLGS